MKKPSPNGKTSRPTNPGLSVKHQIGVVSRAHIDSRPTRQESAMRWPEMPRNRMGNLAAFPRGEEPPAKK